jgi:hypothetical protein
MVLPVISKRPANQRRSSKCKPVVLILCAVALVSFSFILKSSSFLNYYSPTIGVKEDQLSDFYVSARGDQAGAAIHDMLLAHAYGFNHNLTYGGACFEFAWAKPFRKPRGYVLKLMRSLQMTNILRYACPPRGYQDRILNRRLYRDLDATLFTPAWRRQIRSELAVTPVQTTNDDKPFEIAVHVRRGDIDPCIYQTRYLPNSHYIKLIDRYLQNVTGPARVTIYSEAGSYEPFYVFHRKGYRVKLDSDLTDCWKHMMAADVLILSRSSFSYVPAVLNSGIVVYTPFWHGHLQDWDVVDDALMQESQLELNMLITEACARTTAWTKAKRKFWKMIDTINVNTFGL